MGGIPLGRVPLEEVLVTVAWVVVLLFVLLFAGPSTVRVVLEGVVTGKLPVVGGKLAVAEVMLELFKLELVIGALQEEKIIVNIIKIIINGQTLIFCMQPPNNCLLSYILHPYPLNEQNLRNNIS